MYAKQAVGRKRGRFQFAAFKRGRLNGNEHYNLTGLLF
jgi:hypothetical protein